MAGCVRVGLRLDGALARPCESALENQQLTFCAPLISEKASAWHNLLKVVGLNEFECRKRPNVVHMDSLGRPHRRTRQPLEDCWTHHTARSSGESHRWACWPRKNTTASTHLWDAAPPGAPASLSLAAAGVMGVPAGTVKTARTISKLYKIEADTVLSATCRTSDDASCSGKLW